MLYSISPLGAELFIWRWCAKCQQNENIWASRTRRDDSTQFVSLIGYIVYISFLWIFFMVQHVCWRVSPSQSPTSGGQRGNSKQVHRWREPRLPTESHLFLFSFVFCPLRSMWSGDRGHGEAVGGVSEVEGRERDNIEQHTLNQTHTHTVQRGSGVRGTALCLIWLDGEECGRPVGLPHGRLHVMWPQRRRCGSVGRKERK